MAVSQVAEEHNGESGRDVPLVAVVGNVEHLKVGERLVSMTPATVGVVLSEMRWALGQKKINWFSGGGFHVSVDVKGIRFSQSPLTRYRRLFFSQSRVVKNFSRVACRLYPRSELFDRGRCARVIKNKNISVCNYEGQTTDH
jgi:hypothetical protein